LADGVGMRENARAGERSPERRMQPRGSRDRHGGWAMNVQCPHCSTAYLLPEALLGEKGARVRCPKCQGAFVVLREADGVRVESAPGAAAHQGVRGPSPAPPPAPAAETPPALAAAPATDRSLRHVPVEAIQAAERVLDELSAQLGERLTAALAEGRALSEFGPTVMDAYADYRRRMGPAASADAFREALRSRWALDLNPRSEPGR
jgi:predicted Zn finger-like uncharacterized protein